MSGLNNVAFLVEYDGSHPIPPTYQIDLTYVAPYDPWGKMTKVPDDDECIPTEEKINKFIQWAVRKYPAKNLCADSIWTQRRLSGTNTSS